MYVYLSQTDTIKEADLVQNMMAGKDIGDFLVITNLLSTRATEALGDFEIKYLHDPKYLEILARYNPRGCITQAQPTHPCPNLRPYKFDLSRVFP